MKFEGQLNPYGLPGQGGKFEKKATPEELEAIRHAVGGVFEEAKKKEEQERPEKERMVQAKEKIREGLEKEAPRHEITEEDIEEAEKATKQKLH